MSGSDDSALYDVVSVIRVPGDGVRFGFLDAGGGHHQVRLTQRQVDSYARMLGRFSTGGDGSAAGDGRAGEGEGRS